MSVTVEPGRIALVAAVARNGVIGHEGRMPWRMPGDLKTFRRLTMGAAVIMGRKTFQSIGKALDGRINIVVTRDEEFTAPDTLPARSLEDALYIARSAADMAKPIMVIGGGEIYHAALEVADTIYLTRIEAEPEGDTLFPDIDPKSWELFEETTLEPDPRDQYRASLLIYRRRLAH